MPLQPTPGDLHVNRPLTNISIAFMQQPSAFVADRVFPNLPVLKQSDRYFEYDRSFFYRSEMQVRAAGAESAGTGFAVDSSPNYYCPVKAEHIDIADQQRQNADQPINMDRDVTQILSLHAMIRRERDWVSDFFGTGKWIGSTTGTDITPATKWSVAGSTPLDDIEAQFANLELTGYSANKFVMGRNVWTFLKNHAQVLERIKYTQPGGATMSLQLLASLIGVDECLVAKGVRNSAAEGAAPVYEFIADTNDALLCYAAPTASIFQPSAGYTFSWTGMAGAGAMGQRIKRFRLERNEADRLEIQMAWVPKLISSALGVYFNEATS